MKQTKHLLTAGRLTAIVLSIALCLGFTACSGDDDDTETSEIVGTWVISDDTSITFNSNHTGYFTEPIDDEDDSEAKNATRSVRTQTINFTYIYDTSARILTLVVYGETEKWTNVTIANGVLYATDSEGDSFTAVKLGYNNNSEVTGDIDISKLYGTWIYGSMTLTFTESSITIHSYSHEDDGTVKTSTKTYAYAYDESAHTLSILDNGTLTITALTDSRLSLYGWRVDGVWETFTFARKGIEMGDISLLYDKTWRFGTSDDMLFTFKADGTGTMSAYDEEEGSFVTSIKWTYETKGKTITIYGLTGEGIVALSLTGLTSDIMLCSLYSYADVEDGWTDNVVFYAD